SLLDSADSDGDGVSDAVEHETHGSNPMSIDSDGDGLADGSDLFPRSIIHVWPELPEAALISRETPVRFVLKDARGQALEDARIRFGLSLSGAATFSRDARTGTIVSGGGTASVIVESSEGVVELSVGSANVEDVALTVIDGFGPGGSRIGIRAARTDWVFDFESGPQGFSATEPTTWMWGSPHVGPAAVQPSSGDSYLGPIFIGAGRGSLVSPLIVVPPEAPAIEFDHFHLGASEPSRVQVSVDGGPFHDLPGLVGYDGMRGNLIRETEGWERVKVDLSRYAG